jgi:hypothetical protein
MNISLAFAHLFVYTTYRHRGWRMEEEFKLLSDGAQEEKSQVFQEWKFQ